MSEKLYSERDIIAQGEYYFRHTSAMTGEGLHYKSDIAAELAHRDMEIDTLRQQLDQALADVARLREADVRVAEMEDACLRLIQAAPAYGPLWHGSPHVAAVKEALGRSDSARFIKLKQAEALEAVNLKIAIMCETDPQEVIGTEAQRLRGEVDDVE